MASVEITLDVHVTVNGRSLDYGVHNTFASPEDALAAPLPQGVAEGVRARLDTLLAALAGTPEAPQAAEERAVAPNEGPDGSDAARDETSPPAGSLSDSDRAALAHAEHLRNVLRESRQRSAASAAAEAEAVREG